MAGIKRVSGLFGGLACLIAFAFCACESVPENCGDGSRLNSATEFCYGGQAYPKCGGGEYDPTLNKCEGGVLKNKCGGGDNFYDPATEFCTGENVHSKCGVEEYDPASQMCVSGVLRSRCGATGYYDPDAQFCSAGNVYPKCGEHIYDPASQICESNIVKTKCGENYYDSTTEFCVGVNIHSKCDGQIYVPATETCENNVLKGKCGGIDYNPAFEFCSGSEILAKCSGETYDPANQTCENGVLKNKCGNATFNPATEFCTNGEVYPITYTLTVSANPAGSGFVSREPETETYNAGTLVNVTAAAAEGYTFTGWTGASTVTAKAIQITMDTNKVLTANFQPIPSEIKTDGIDMILVDGGTFMMGCTNEQVGDCESNENPVHRVTVSGFYLGKFEVTQGQWAKVMGTYPSYHRGDDNYPVEQVSWNQIDTFIVELNKMTGKKYRLPTEAEWEFAARGGNKSGGFKYSGSDTLGNVAWYGCYNASTSSCAGNSSTQTHIVGVKAPNELGLYDMSGNVEEWVNDRYGTYSSSVQTDPTGPASGSYRVSRGGSARSNNTSTTVIVKQCRVSWRGNYNYPSDKGDRLGFRLALDP